MKKMIFTALAVLFALMVFEPLCSGQEVNCKGYVSDKADNVGIPGVSVVVQGIKTGTTTDASGHYQLKAPKGRKLIASCIGYKTKEKPAKDVTNFELVTEEAWWKSLWDSVLDLAE